MSWTITRLILLIVWMVALAFFTLIPLLIFKEKHKVTIVKLFPHIIKCNCKEKKAKK